MWWWDRNFWWDNLWLVWTRDLSSTWWNHREEKNGGGTLHISWESLFDKIIGEITKLVKSNVLSVIERWKMWDEEFTEYSRIVKEALEELPILLTDVKKDIVLTLSDKQYNNEI